MWGSSVKIFRSNLKIVTKDLATEIGLEVNNMQMVFETVRLDFPDGIRR